MTIGSLLLGTIVSQILFVIIKVTFIGSLNLDSWLIWAAFMLALVIVTIATVRRMGILNYIETFFLMIIWFFVTLAVDYVITTRFTSLDIYQTWTYWITYLVTLLSVLFFHKSFHVQVRKAASK